MIKLKDGRGGREVNSLLGAGNGVWGAGGVAGVAWRSGGVPHRLDGEEGVADVVVASGLPPRRLVVEWLVILGGRGVVGVTVVGRRLGIAAQVLVVVLLRH